MLVHSQTVNSKIAAATDREIRLHIPDITMGCMQ